MVHLLHSSPRFCIPDTLGTLISNPDSQRDSLACENYWQGNITPSKSGVVCWVISNRPQRNFVALNLRKRMAAGRSGRIPSPTPKLHRPPWRGWL